MTIETGTLDLTLYPGGTWTETLTLTDGSGAALNLSAYTPFVAQIRRHPGRDLIADITIDGAGAAAGVLVLSLSVPADERGKARWDMIDKNRQRWLQGAVEFDPNVSEPEVAP